MEEIKVFKDERDFSDSKMLNKPGHHVTASVAWSVKNQLKVDASSHSSPSYSTYANLYITDCYKGIRLDFDFSGNGYTDQDEEEDIDNALYKIDTLMNALKDMREKMVIGAYNYDSCVQIRKDIPEKEVVVKVPLEEAVKELIEFKKNNSDGNKQSEVPEAS